ncbi:MAG: M1 family metallopeptidase [Acidimicrobiales bacterium]|nr:M1 family metallopeptidase [Acidimicrobiales bacterium]
MTEREPAEPSPASTSPDDPGFDPFRLPSGVRPVRYDLCLEPDLAAATFDGTVAVVLAVEEPSTRIVANAVELEVDEAWVVTDAGERIETLGVDLDAETERVTFRLAEPVHIGTITLHVRFRGILNDKLRGFYRSTFTDTDGVEQTIATTQFEATDARRAFPCWDEPAHKAVFGVTLVVDADLFAVSNAAEVARGAHPDDPSRHVVRFADTMVMSTYLVAFVVGPLEATDPVDVDGTPVRVVFPRGKGHLTAYALEVAEFCLRHFAEYYDIPYPGDKLDLVAVPDFAFGAMENLGCVTFREVLLLVDPAEVTQAELLNVTDVINHELAHMWFGDLVTMKWWNGIWLNEAFATFMEMHATDAFRPAWDRWATFGLARSAAFDTDALASTRPIEYPVVSPSDAEGMFDILTYEKGAAVVRMLEQYLGAEAFRDGIRHYLRTYAYGNTETTELWDALEAATGEPVRRIMDSWILQGGFPEVTVDLVDDGATLRLGQHRFGYAGDLGEGDDTPAPALDHASRWSIPVILSQKTTHDDLVTFERVLLEDDTLDVTLIEAVEWVLANTESTGFYRARYAPDLLAALVTHAQADLSPVERYAVVDDTWASVLAGDTTSLTFLDMLPAFAGESDLSVWQRIVGCLTALHRLVDDDVRPGFRRRVGALLGPAADRLGPEPGSDESDRQRALRGVLFEARGVLAGSTAVAAAARTIVAHPATADPAMVAAAVNVVAATGGEAEFELFLRRFRDASTPQEELRYLSALADFDDPDLMRRLLTLSTTEIRTQNAPLLLRRALTNRTQGPLAWYFVADEWDTINDRFPSNSIARLLEGVRSLSSPEVASSVFAFFETHEVPQGDKILAQHLERLEVNVALLARDGRALNEALA